METDTCLGCSIANQLVEVHVVFEDEHISCILDIAPFNEGHIIILPKQHFYELEDLTPEVLTAIMHASVKMSRMIKSLYKPDGITICQNGGDSLPYACHPSLYERWVYLVRTNIGSSSRDETKAN